MPHVRLSARALGIAAVAAMALAGVLAMLGIVLGILGTEVVRRQSRPNRQVSGFGTSAVTAGVITLTSPMPARRRLVRRSSMRPAAIVAVAALLLVVTLVLPAASSAASGTLTLAPSTASAGDIVAASGSGLPHDAMLDLSFDGSEAGMPSGKASADGTIQLTFTVPGAAPGSHTVELDLGSNTVASATLTVGPTATPSGTPTPAATATATAPATPAPTATAAPTATPAPTTTASTGAIPAFNHVYWIVMENHEYSSIVGSSSAPYINSLISSYGLATNYDAVSHPSEPNYLALFSGSTQGVTDDGTYNFSGANLADRLEAAGKTWHLYEQDYPGGCFTGSSYSGGVDLLGLAGSYVRKHDPAISFTDISGNSTRCSQITSLASFSPSAADFEMIVPNLMNDMHDGTIAEGDAFLQAFVPLITTSAAFAGSALFITWDEGSTNTGGGGHVATLVIAPGMTPGFRSATAYNHYSLLRTVEDAWGPTCLGNSCGAAPMSDFPY